MSVQRLRFWNFFVLPARVSHVCSDTQVSPVGVVVGVDVGVSIQRCLVHITVHCSAHCPHAPCAGAVMLLACELVHTDICMHDQPSRVSRWKYGGGGLRNEMDL